MNFQKDTIKQELQKGEKVMINFNKNDLINITLDRYYDTFAHTLDTSDFVPEKFNKKIAKYIFKNMKKAFKRIDKEDRKYQRKLRKEERKKQGNIFSRLFKKKPKKEEN